MYTFKDKNTNYLDYPTKEEYIDKVKKIQSDELESDRYKNIYSYLDKNYWNRSEFLEEELFGLIGNRDIYNLKDFGATCRIYSLKALFSTCNVKVIKNNLFLKSAYNFLSISNTVCCNIINELYKELDRKSLPSHVTIRVDIPEELNKYILTPISTQVGIKYYRTEAYRISFIDVLDSAHKYVYDDYNEVAIKINKICEDIFYLKMNDLLCNAKNFNCLHVQIYNPGNDNHINVSFSINNKVNKKEIVNELKKIH